MLMDNIVSYENNVMLAAILCLLLVILFVLLLHIYARWFLAEARQRRTTATLSMARVLGPARLSQEHTTTTTYTYNNSSLHNTQLKGLNQAEIDSIPLFIYSFDCHAAALECAICLSVLEEKEVGRILPRCSHAFHVECIDMWLHSHSTCPNCRSQVLEVEVDVKDKIVEDSGTSVNDHQSVTVGDSISVAEILVDINDDEEIDNVVTSDQTARLDCSIRRMLSRCSSENRVHPSSAGSAT